MTTSLKRFQSLDFDTVALATWTAIALATELVVLRLLTRTAIHIPGLGEIEAGIRFFSEVGRIAFNAALILVFALLVAMTIDAVNKTRWPLVVALAAVLGIAIVAPLGWLPEPIIDLITIVVVIAAPLLGWLSRNGSLKRSSPSMLFSTAFTVAALPTLVGKAHPGTTLPVVGMLNVAEALALVGAFSLLILVWGRPRWSALIVAALVGVATAGMLAAQPATIEILMLWNLGLAGYFSSVVYGVAAGMFAYAAVTSAQRGQPAVALGVVFVITGGIGLHSTLQSASFFIGVLILAYPHVINGRHAPTDDPTMATPARTARTIAA